ncbi:hypothetical protein [Brevibacterium album]|uniref:hypothetical protein n=1 Tax=Brevibacterium album TaxID=417948 RepID=UPI0003F60BE7|nr:hypothetical protein [Brevibacterium album]
MHTKNAHRALGGTAALGLAVVGLSFSSTAANAQTEVIIDSGHIDIVGIDEPGEIGSIFGDDGGYISWDDIGSDKYVLEYDVNRAGVSCSAGVYTASAANIGGTNPWAGFSDHTGSTYSITMSKVGGTANTGDVTFTESVSNVTVLDTSVPLEWDLSAYAHTHGAWTFDSGTGDCSAPDQPAHYDFDLEFDVDELGGSNDDDHTFTFRVVR